MQHWEADQQQYPVNPRGAGQYGSGHAHRMDAEHSPLDQGIDKRID
jgi:hypothetical protein